MLKHIRISESLFHISKSYFKNKTKYHKLTRLTFYISIMLIFAFV